MRRKAADRATPTWRLTSVIKAAPAADANQAPEVAGPINTAAWALSPITSARRIGNRPSKVTIEKPQKSSTRISVIRTRDERRRRRPSRMTPGTAATELATARASRAVRTSRMSVTMATSPTTWRPMATRTGSARVSTVGNGSRAMRPPASSAPDAIARLSTVRARPETRLDLRVGLGRERRVDVPGLERPAVERAIDALQEHRRREHRHRVGEEDERERKQADEAREDQDRPTTERVRETTGRQLEGEHDEALDREDDPDLGQRQAARERQQHEDRDEQAGREPAKGQQDQVAPPRGARVERRHRGGSPSGKAWWWHSTGRASGSSGSGSRYRSSSACISAWSSASRRGDTRRR